MEELTNLEKELRLIGKEEFSIGDYHFSMRWAKELIT